MTDKEFKEKHGLFIANEFGIKTKTRGQIKKAKKVFKNILF